MQITKTGDSSLRFNELGLLTCRYSVPDKLELTQSAKDFLIDNGYDEVYGARPLKRFVQKKLETLIAKKILTQEILPNTTVVIDCNDEGLYVK